MLLFKFPAFIDLKVETKEGSDGFVTFISSILSGKVKDISALNPTNHDFFERKFQKPVTIPPGAGNFLFEWGHY